MKISTPSNCGNSPRMAIVRDFVVAWANADSVAMHAWLASDSTWAIVGGATHAGIDNTSSVAPPLVPELLEISTVITHGRLASCDGFIEQDTKRIDFSHVVQFTGASKTAKIAEIRSYFIES